MHIREKSVYVIESFVTKHKTDVGMKALVNKRVESMRKEREQ